MRTRFFYFDCMLLVYCWEQEENKISLNFDPMKEILEIRFQIDILMKKVSILRKIHVIMKSLALPFLNYFSLNLNRKKTCGNEQWEHVLVLPIYQRVILFVPGVAKQSKEAGWIYVFMFLSLRLIRWNKEGRWVWYFLSLSQGSSTHSDSVI